MIKANQFVLFTHPKRIETLVGYIDRSTPKSLSVSFQAGDEVRRYSTGKGVSRFQLEKGLMIRDFDNREVPEQLQKLSEAASVTAKKGTIVQFSGEGQQFTGRVLKGGKRATVSCGPTLYKVSAHLLSPHTMAPAEPELEDWDVSTMTEVPGHDDCPSFVATITYKGQAVIEASNDGWGGPNLYRNMAKDGIDYIAQLNAQLEQIKKDGELILPEAMDIWLFWQWDYRPAGGEQATFTKHARISDEEFAAMLAGK